MSFSIILPTFNRANKIAVAIQSVLEQTISDWELIIIDDGSTDETKSVIKSFSDERIQYYFQSNSERASARNLGIKKAKNDWICFLDSDDYFLPNHLEVFSNHINVYPVKHPFLATLSYTEKNNVRKENQGIPIKKNTTPAKSILEQTTITPINVCILKKCFNSHLFPENFKKAYWEDTHLWIRLSIDFSFFQIEKYTSVLVQHESRSVDSFIGLKRVKDHISMIMNLYNNYPKVKELFTEADFTAYCDRKYRTFLYVTRQNRQLSVAIKIWYLSIKNKFSFYLMREFPKIFINFIGIGIHER